MSGVLFAIVETVQFVIQEESGRILQTAGFLLNDKKRPE